MRGAYAVNSSADISDGLPLASGSFSQDFNMYLVPGATGDAGPSAILLLAAVAAAAARAMD